MRQAPSLSPQLGRLGAGFSLLAGGRKRLLSAPQNRMPERSISMMMFLEQFKGTAAEGAVVELKLRLLGKAL
jgi:hypothetical protein